MSYPPLCPAFACFQCQNSTAAVMRGPSPHRAACGLRLSLPRRLNRRGLLPQGPASPPPREPRQTVPDGPWRCARSSAGRSGQPGTGAAAVADTPSRTASSAHQPLTRLFAASDQPPRPRPVHKPCPGGAGSRARPMWLGMGPGAAEDPACRQRSGGGGGGGGGQA